MGRGASDQSSATPTTRSQTPKRPAKRWVSLRDVPADGPVDVLGRALDPASRPDLDAILADAAGSNLQIPVYRDLIASCGADRHFVAVGCDPDDPDILAVHEHGRTTIYEDVLDRYLAQPVFEEPAPGLRNANVLGLAAMLRHEHAHELWGRLGPAEAEYVCELVPRDAASIGSDLTAYAGEAFGDAPLLEDTFYFPSRRFAETFCECFEVASHPRFRQEQFPDWVGQTWERILELL